MHKHVRLLRAVAFAAEKHRHQRRKDANASPFINHLIAAASVLAEEGHVTDEDLLVAAILHDSVEDTETTFASIEEHFGRAVADIVREVTDDQTLAKEERKRLQEVRSPHASSQAKQLKIADKICNIRDIVHNPPANWPTERKREYLQWSIRVIAGCRGVNVLLDQAFDETVKAAARHLGVN